MAFSILPLSLHHFYFFFAFWWLGQDGVKVTVNIVSVILTVVEDGVKVTVKVLNRGLNMQAHTLLSIEAKPRILVFSNLLLFSSIFQQLQKRIDVHMFYLLLIVLISYLVLLRIVQITIPVISCNFIRIILILEQVG